MSVPRLRLIPFKMLALLWYGYYVWMERDPTAPAQRMFRAGQMGKLLRISHAKVWDHLRWLERQGYLTLLSSPREPIKLILTYPPGTGPKTLIREA